MLRSPLHAFSVQRSGVVAAVVTLAAALWLGAAFGAAALQAERVLESRWEQYQPVVYFQAGVDVTVVEGVKEEMEAWTAVSSVEVETPQQALLRLQDRLGEEEVRKMGVTYEMMPTTLIVEVGLWNPAQAEIVSRVKALEVRESIIAVDVPDAASVAWLNQGRGVVLGVSAALLLLLLGALLSVATLLRRMQREEGRENHLLEVFGASPKTLMGPTLWRGAALGAMAGGVAGTAFLPWALILDNFVAHFSAVGAFSAVSAALWAVALLPLGGLLGALVGWRCGRPSNSTKKATKSLLNWEQEL